MINFFFSSFFFEGVIVFFTNVDLSGLVGKNRNESTRDDIPAILKVVTGSV